MQKGVNDIAYIIECQWTRPIVGSHQPVPYSDGNDFHIGTDPVLHRDADDAREKAESIFDFDADPDSVEPNLIPIYFVIDEMKS